MAAKKKAEVETKVLKCAFIVVFEGTTPKTYAAVHKNPQCQCLVAGVDNQRMGIKYVRKLVELGYTVINLSGEFGDSVAEMLEREAGEGFKIRNARYSIDEIMKLHWLDRYNHYGLIIKLPGVEKPQETVIRSKVCDTRVIFVKDMRQARNAARRMIEKRVQLIELNTWFDRLRMYTVLDAINDAVPVGICGDLNMKEWEDE